MANVITKKQPEFSKASPQGKGTWQRPVTVGADEWAKRWERAFGKRKRRRRR